MNDIFTVDARGLSCPQPVLETKRAFEESDALQLKILVDNAASKENVKRFATNQGCEVQIQGLGAEQYEILVRRPTGEPPAVAIQELLPCPLPDAAESRKNVLYIGTDSMGLGDEELGQKLMRGFLRTWIDITPLPWRMILINSGVKLSTLDEEAVEAISLLEERGVEVLSCGTCLQHFGLTDKLRVGRVTNMFEVIESFNSANKVISPD
ncbi:MAG: sulfurtransferase-like selenium metabolism protein YedF [Desulfomonile tiedjei]|uniref:Sulfurtransferase-like selenium metabolism protein YedF n=1 Tax=Desulfomonile tiedjei TaxID=2358 RepID=A0A9D6V2M3_9BACT|nr:sulfurtransferase-like selenium metabolism protein YedF [Desulfomonile tiedjei]